MKGFC